MAELKTLRRDGEYPVVTRVEAKRDDWEAVNRLIAATLKVST